VYAGVPGPLSADDVADCIVWAATRPWNVNVDLLVVRPRAQAAQHKIYREATP
jgi:NADP-dependent 3-hydroxy acid dehydrogenase YdfG